MAATSAGKILLAGAQKEQIASVLSRGLPRLTPYTPASPRLVLSQIDQARRSGYATAHAEWAVGQSSVSVQIDRGAAGMAVALTLLAPASSRDLTRWFRRCARLRGRSPKPSNLRRGFVDC